MILNFTYDSSVSSAPVGFTATLNSIVSFFQSTFLDPITVNIAVGYGEVHGQTVDSGAIGQSFTSLRSYSYSQIKSALAADAKSGDDANAIASLPANDPTGGHYWLATAEAKALGLSNGTGLDGSVGFSSSRSFDYDSSNGVAQGQYDFFGVVAHEVSEIMGRQLLVGGTVGNTPNGYEPMDLFHFASNGTRIFSGSQPGYFSPDNGTTNLGNFNTNLGGDFGDWAASAGRDAALAFSSSGVVNAFSQNDIRVMDTIGWDVFGGLPAPVDHPPVIAASDVKVTVGQMVVVSNLFSVSDSDNDPITMYRVLDNTPGNGFFVVNGAARASGQTLILTPSELASSTFHVSGSDNLQVSAFDGIAWSDPKSFNISADNAPVVAAQDVIVNPGQTVGVSSLFSVGDADNDPITMYRLLDNTPGNGFFVVNGAARASGQMLTLTPSELASSTFHASGSDNLQISAFDGMAWSDPKSFNVSGDHLSIVAASDVKVPVGQSVAVSSLFSVSDADNDPITMYRLLDNTPGNGFFIVNGAARSDGQTLLLTPSELASSTFHASGSDNLQISAFDGIAWSDPKSFNVGADHPPVVAAQDVIVNPGQTVGVASLFSVSDADNDPITMYRLLDDTPGNGFFVVNGAARSDGQKFLLTPSELASSSFHAGASAGSADSVEISAFDGIVWSDPATIHIDVLI